MIIYVAQIEDGIVTRGVSPAGIQHPECLVVVGPENTVGIEWAYGEEVFV